MNRLQTPADQQGMALLTVLLIFAIVSVLAVAMIDRQSSDIQRSGTMLALQQARAYVLGAESAVRTGLYLDWDNNHDVDFDGEEWAQERSFPLEPGTAYILIQDAQGRFNLNWMSKTSANREVQRLRFRNLLDELGLDVGLGDLVYRWMDEESQDDDRYLAMDPPYRAAYRQCSHTSELMLIEGFDLASYKKIEGYVSCLPITAQLNVNTASAVVLAALDSNLSLDTAQAIISARGDEGFSEVSDFWSLSEIKEYTRKAPARSGDNDKDENQAATSRWDETDFSVKSEFFESFIRIDLGDRMATAEVLIKRNSGDGSMQTYYRDFSRREARQQAELSSAPQIPEAR